MNIVTWSDEVFVIGQKKEKDAEGKVTGVIEGTGSTVNAKLRKLRTKDMATIMPIMQGDLPQVEQVAALTTLEDVLDRCIDHEHGILLNGELVKVDGNKASAEDLANEVALSELSWGIITQLINISSLSEGDKGN